MRLPANFEEKILKTDTCWVWLGATVGGYGKCIWRNENWLAHRAVYTMLVGEIPRGLNALHKCDNPGCVKPTHIFLGTQKENHADMQRKGRGFTAKLRGDLGMQINQLRGWIRVRNYRARKFGFKYKDKQVDQRLLKKLIKERWVANEPKA